MKLELSFEDEKQSYGIIKGMLCLQLIVWTRTIKVWISMRTDQESDFARGCSEYIN